MSALNKTYNKRKSRIFISKTKNINTMNKHQKSKSFDVLSPIHDLKKSDGLKPLKLEISSTFVINLGPWKQSIDEDGSLLSDTESEFIYTNISDNESNESSSIIQQTPSVSEECGLDLDEPNGTFWYF
mmetsp:Transcript_96429/g.118183  ORF Transcript_96429/g.118183 Transcript_96429/m.118183 type:complete len:128 (-) Transcript_96429:118-501(-)